MLTLMRSIRLKERLPLPNGDRLDVNLDVEAHLPELIRAQNGVILAARAGAGTPGDRRSALQGRPGVSELEIRHPVAAVAPLGGAAADKEGGHLGPTRGERIENSPIRSCGVREAGDAADKEGGALAPTSPSNSEGFVRRSCGAPFGHDAADRREALQGRLGVSELKIRHPVAAAAPLGGDAADTPNPFLEAYRALLQIVLGRDGLERALAAHGGALRAVCAQLDGWVGAALVPRIRAASARTVRRRKSQARWMLRRAR